MNFAKPDKQSKPPPPDQPKKQPPVPPSFRSAVNVNRKSQQTREALEAAVAAAAVAAETVRPPPPPTPPASSATESGAAAVVAASPQATLKRQVNTTSSVGFKSSRVDTPTHTASNKKRHVASGTAVAPALVSQQPQHEHSMVPPLYSVHYHPPKRTNPQPVAPAQQLQHPTWYRPMGIAASPSAAAMVSTSTAHEATYQSDDSDPQTTTSPASSETSESPVAPPPSTSSGIDSGNGSGGTSSGGPRSTPMYHPNIGVFEVPSAHSGAAATAPMPVVGLQHPPVYQYVATPIAHPYHHQQPHYPMPRGIVPPAVAHGSPCYPYYHHTPHLPTLHPYHDVVIPQWSGHHHPPAMHPHVLAGLTMIPTSQPGGPFPLFMSRVGNEQHHRLRAATRPTMVTTTAASTDPPVAALAHDFAAGTPRVNIDNMPTATASLTSAVTARVTPPQNGVSSISTSNSSGSRSGHQPTHQSPITKSSKNSVYVLVQTLHHSADAPFLQAERDDSSSPPSNLGAAVATAAVAAGKKEKCTVETVVHGVYSTMEVAQHWFEAKEAQSVVVISETNEGQQLLHLDTDDTVQASLQIHEVSLGVAPPGM